VTELKSRLCLLPILAITIIVATGCGGDSNPLFRYQGRWVSDIPFTYSIGYGDVTVPHDNRIYETTNYLIFSDASSDIVKITTSITAEEKLGELKQAFDISNSAELGITDQNTKIMMYLNRNDMSLSSRFFPCGMIIYSLDSPWWQNFEATSDPPMSAEDCFHRVVKHELMHVFQHLLGLGLDGYDDWPDVWFTEGIAEYVCCGTFTSFTSISDVNSWAASEDHINPISIHKFTDYPIPLERVGEYYPMFHLAVRYLLSDKGAGKKLSDVKLMYGALRNGDSFTDAFETYMGMSLDYFEDNFYSLIPEIL